MSTCLQPLVTLAVALRACARGNSATELALVAPVLIVIVFAAFDYGGAYVESVRLSGAAQAGAQQALFDPLDWDNTARAENAALEDYAGAVAEEADYLPVTATATAFCACTSGATTACASSCPDGAEPGRFLEVALSRSRPLLLPYPWNSTGTVDVQNRAVVRVR